MHPELTAGFAAHHDASLRRCLSQFLGVDPSVVYWDLASLPLSLGGTPKRHIDVPTCLLVELGRLSGHGSAATPNSVRLHRASSQPPTHLAGFRACGAQLAAVGFHAPSWEELAHGVRPESRLGYFDPGLPRHGWQRIATIPVHGELVEGCVRPRLSQSEQALFRSQGGLLSSVPFTCFPTSPLTRFDASLFRVLLLRRLWLPLPLPRASAGVSLMSLATTVQLARRQGCWVVEVMLLKALLPGFAARVTNVMVRDLDLLPLHQVDARRLEVVADGLPLFHGAQVALDTTLVSPLRRDGTPHTRCAVEDGVALMQARRRKERTYPELSGAHGRARLVVLACEVGGQMVFRNTSKPPAACQGQDSPFGSSHQRQVGLVVEVELDSGLCQCPRLRTVSVGRTCCSWARWPFHDD